MNKKQILFYSQIDDISASYLVRKLLEKDGKPDVEIKLSTMGGNVGVGKAIITNMRTREGATDIFVDGSAYSMGGMMLLFADNVKASSLSDAMFHKASYSTWYKPSKEEKEKIERFNNEAYEQIQAKAKDNDTSKRLLKGFKDGKDVYLTSSEMLEAGIVNEVIAVEPTQSATDSIQYKKYQFLKELDAFQEQSLNNTIVMNLEKFKAEHPDVLKQALDEERSRVTGLTKYALYVPEMVQAKIIDGSVMDEAFMEAVIEAKTKVTVAEGMQNANPNADGQTVEIVPVTPVIEAEMSAEDKLYHSEVMAHLEDSGATEDQLTKYKKQNKIK